jgi:nicotinate dehydrogenase subunit B
MRRESFTLDRRAFLGSGGLVVAFSLVRPGWAQEMPPPGPAIEDLPGDLPDAPYLDAWIRIAPDGEITVFTGKAELGQGAKTALRMVAAEELRVSPTEITLVTADTGQTPDEGYTAGSQTMSNSGTAIRVAAANVRQLLSQEAARQLGVADTGLTIGDKAISADGRSLGYGELAAALDLHVVALADVPLIAHEDLAVMGTDVQRVDIPAKLTGGEAYIQDWRAEGMVHARVIRPPSPGAVLASVDDAEVSAMPGVLGIVRDGSFLAVVAEQEYQAVLAMRALSTRVTWSETASLPDRARLNETLRALESEVGTVAEAGSPEIPEGDRTLRATFSRPYLMHGSMGPSCAVAQFADGELTVWSHTQGVFPDRTAIAEMLGMDEAALRVIHVEGAGCYGHNGADDAAADAALIATRFPDRPVRVQWMREQEHGWEPYGPAMVMDIAATVGEDGRISNWNYDLWSNSHSSRPGGAGNLLAGQYKSNGASLELPGLRITASGNGDRNAIPYYAIPNHRERWHFIHDMPLRVSALRGLGAHANVFAIESFMDDLAILAETDPVEFRLRHLEDLRARDVVQRVVDEGGWSAEPLPPNVGRGFAFARYKNIAAYLALSVTAEVSPETGRVKVRHVVCAIDSGEVVSLDGIRNQTEGGICQSLSWTLYEEVTFDTMRPTSIDWASYPMLRFASVPDTIAVHVMDRPNEPFLGTGEAAQGPAAAAIGNAVRDAIGVRIHDMPMTRERIMAARLI